MLRSTVVAALAILTLTISACHKGNGAAQNAPAPVVDAKGLWILADDVREFRKTGRVDSICKNNSNADVRDSVCVVDEKGGIFAYAEKSWTSNSENARLGTIDTSGRVTFKEIASWQFDKSLFAQARVDRDAMIWSYKHDGQTTAVGSEPRPDAEFTRTTNDEVRAFAKAEQACGHKDDGRRN